MRNNIIKFRSEWFGAYGLDKNKNFLQVPLCECGCGRKASLVLEDIKDLFQFMNMMLMENDCNHCAIFAYVFDGCMYVALKLRMKLMTLFYSFKSKKVIWDSSESGMMNWGYIVME